LQILRILLESLLQFLTAKVCEMRETWDNAPFGIESLEFFSLGLIIKISHAKTRRREAKK